MPYEIASGMVRTLVHHYKRLGDAYLTYKTHLEDDETESSEQTRKAKKAFQDMLNTKLYMVMNPRTCQLATPEWLSKHIQINQQGLPTAKYGKKSEPWVMTLFFSQATHPGGDVVLRLQLASKASPACVRCWELETGEEKKKIANLLAGYNFDQKDGEDDEHTSEAESEKTVVGDEDGLEGSVVMLAIGFSTSWFMCSASFQCAVFNSFFLYFVY